MKYIVEVTTSNPSHEHISLRRVQKKTNFVVEASNETEAMTRARGKFRSLGYYVHETAIVEMSDEQRYGKTGAEIRRLGGEEAWKNRPKDKEGNLKYLAQLKAKADEKKDEKPAETGAQTVVGQANADKPADAAPAADAAKPETTAAAAAPAAETSKEKKDFYAGVGGREKGKYYLGQKPGPEWFGRDDKGVFFGSQRGDDPTPSIGRVINRLGRAANPARWFRKRDDAPAAPSTKTEEFSYIEEKLTLKDPMSKWISDFVHSENPKFEGKSKKERINMALGARYAAERAAKNEEVEVVAEAEGRLATTPKEKALAAHHGDPKRITFGDVLKARLKGKKVDEESEIAKKVREKQERARAESNAKQDKEAKDHLKSIGMSDANIAKKMEKPMREQAAPVPNPNAVPKPPKQPKEPGTTDYTLNPDPTVPNLHPLEAERAKVEAEVRKRQAELAKKPLDKMKKEDVDQKVDHIVKNAREKIKGKLNKVNMKPEMDTDVKTSTVSGVHMGPTTNSTTR